MLYYNCPSHDFNNICQNQGYRSCFRQLLSIFTLWNMQREQILRLGPISQLTVNS